MSYGKCGMKPRLTPPILGNSAPRSVNAIAAGRSQQLLEEAPLGTKAPSLIGGHWTKVDRGWQAMGGDVVPRPGGDWDGCLIYPSNT